MAPDISIVILTCNGLGTLPAVLSALEAQETSRRVETVAIDSGSTDGTVEFLRSRVDRLVEIPPDSFNHGATRNAAIGHSAGSFVVLLVQDAVPESPRWLENLVAPLLADDTLAGSCARQRPRPEASAITRYYLEQWLAASPTPRVSYVASPEAFDRLAPADRFAACVFDNVCSCVRRSVWVRHPFRTARIAEDLEWAREVLLAGYGLAYVPDAVVVHSHDRPARYELMRTYLVHQRLRALFGLGTIPDAPGLLRAWASTVPLHLRCAANGSRFGPSPRALWRAVALAFAFPLGQYLGVRSTDTGRELLRVRGV